MLMPAALRSRFAAALLACVLASPTRAQEVVQSVADVPPAETATTSPPPVLLFESGAPTQPDPLAELRSRIDQVEAQNNSLRSELQELKTAGPSSDPHRLTSRWNHGFEVQTADERFRVHVGGRTQFDGVWIADTDNLAGAGGAGDGDAVDFRRARLRVDGTMYDFIEWAVEYDFVNSVNDNVGLQPANEVNVVNVPAPTDLWFNIARVPVFGNVRIGNMKEPLGFEHQISSRFLEFMERSYVQDVFTGAFNNGFSPGVMLWNTFAGERGTWHTGVFKNTVNVFAFNVGDGEYAWTSRLTYLLRDEDEGADLLHVGVSGSIRDPDNDLLRYRTRMSVRNGPGAINPVIADTGLFFADTQNILGAELAWNRGPLCVQAEYMGGWNEDSVGGFGPFLGVPLGTTYVDCWYAEALWFLTGEHRSYEHERGAFGRVIPNENFDFRGGCGAWQIGARYQRLNLNRDGLVGGIVEDVTIGLNWFLNPNLKLQWNYVATWRDNPRSGVDGPIYAAGMRLAHDF